MSFVSQAGRQSPLRRKEQAAYGLSHGSRSRVYGSAWRVILAATAMWTRKTWIYPLSNGLTPAGAQARTSATSTGTMMLISRILWVCVRTGKADLLFSAGLFVSGLGFSVINRHVTNGSTENAQIVTMMRRPPFNQSSPTTLPSRSRSMSGHKF